MIELRIQCDRCERREVFDWFDGPGPGWHFTADHFADAEHYPLDGSGGNGDAVYMDGDFDDVVDSTVLCPECHRGKEET